MAPGQEANGDNLGQSFRSSTQEWYVECTHKNHLDQAILSIHNIPFHDIIRNFT